MGRDKLGIKQSKPRVGAADAPDRPTQSWTRPFDGKTCFPRKMHRPALRRKLPQSDCRRAKPLGFGHHLMQRACDTCRKWFH